MIDRGHDLPIRRQAALVNISRGSAYYTARPVSDDDLKRMRRIDGLHLERRIQPVVATPSIKEVLWEDLRGGCRS